MEDQITQIAKQAINDKVFPGCIVGVVKINGERTMLPFGTFTYDSDSLEIKEDTIFDVASLTKSIVAGALALKLIDEGKLSLNDKLIDYIPEFRNSDRDNVFIKHLLTYTLDGYGLASLGKKTPNELMEYVMTHDFEKRPGEVFKYTNIPAALLGLVVEKIYEETLDNLADKYFFEPLKMERTTFHPGKFSLNEIVPTEIDHRGLVHGVVHDESAWILKTKANKVIGHAGLFSTAPDILNFLEMLLNRGMLNNRKYFSQKIIEQMHTNQIEELGDYTGLGWELYQPRYMGKNSTPHTFGKTGFTGCLCICDINKGVAYVILSNRIYPKRPKDSTAINAFRASIGDIVWEDQK